METLLYSYGINLTVSGFEIMEKLLSDGDAQWSILFDPVNFFNKYK